MKHHIAKHLNKDNLHHAYLIEGARGNVVPEVLKFVESMGVEIIGNSDVVDIHVDTFKIEDARNLKSHATEKGISSNKKIYVISVNNFLLDAQNSLLKMFEEPIDNTHFFVVVPDANALMATLLSRFYVISGKGDLEEELKKGAEKFLAMPMPKRIEFIKELLAEAEEKDENGNPVALPDSARSKAVTFLNILESVLHHKIYIQGSEKHPKDHPGVLIPFRQIFQVRKFLRQPGSSAKTLMESVALVVPEF